jgi:leucyl aminopeptidase
MAAKNRSKQQTKSGRTKFPKIEYSLYVGEKKPADGDGYFYFVGVQDLHKISHLVEREALSYQKKNLLKKSKDLIFFNGLRGPVWIYCPQAKSGPFSHAGLLEESLYAQIRDQVGTVFSSIKSTGISHLHIELHGTQEPQEVALLVALGLSSYSFKSSLQGKSSLDEVMFSISKKEGKLTESVFAQAESISQSVNLARHLVNMPPNFLNPSSMVELVKEWVKGKKNISCEIWDEKRLKKEGMGLHLAVGQGAKNPPALIHIRYRPKSKSKLKPMAFVGKGITFDSGGYDIKPSSGMRLMKKDMGGAACIMGLAHWVSVSHYHRPMDFYLAMAENMVDAKSFRPSDVITARNGLQIEIHNTDAEGRLVLADALDVAVTQKGADEPSLVVDVATLTGAIKVALGGDLAGLFSNQDDLAEQMNRAGQAAGDLNWRMPLYAKYTGSMSSHFADYVNAVDGFGGAITAALFLEKFVKQKPWAHLDIYAWNDKPTGPLSFAGGSGQGVQCLIQFLKSCP